MKYSTWRLLSSLPDGRFKAQKSEGTRPRSHSMSVEEMGTEFEFPGSQAWPPHTAWEGCLRGCADQ